MIRRFSLNFAVGSESDGMFSKYDTMTCSVTYPEEENGKPITVEYVVNGNEGLHVAVDHAIKDIRTYLLNPKVWVQYSEPFRRVQEKQRAIWAEDEKIYRAKHEVEHCQDVKSNLQGELDYWQKKLQELESQLEKK